MATPLSPVIQDFPALEKSGYRLRVAQTPEDLERVQRLRFEVFNVELGEGFEEAWASELDQDCYDPHTHHLMVEHLDADRAVGTYRLQTLQMAERGAGFYTASEYDLSPLRDILPVAVEASRACVHKDHREGPPIQLLWRGIGTYMTERKCRYLFGLNSLTSQDVEEGIRAWSLLRERGWLHPELRVAPLPEFECAPAAEIENTRLPPLPKLPPLFDAYVRIATRVVGYPAIDRAFRTIDYLILLDLEEMPPPARRRYLPAS